MNKARLAIFENIFDFFVGVIKNKFSENKNIVSKIFNDYALESSFIFNLA